jgi:putative FmdB family regulatory protein
MPVYDYKCSTCFSVIEFKREFGEDREPLCCQQTMVRQWSSPGVLFNAPGFYSTDNRKK